MPDFTFEALARTGTKSTGTLTANSEREAALILDGRGLFPLKILLAKTQASGAGGFFGGVLGPTFGFLSLLALLLTVMLQREQLSLSRKQVAESSAELARSHEIQVAAARAMAEQAHYAAISARAVALGAALEVVGRQVKEAQFSGGQGFATRTGGAFEALYKEHERMTAELLEVTRNLVAPTVTSAPTEE